MPPSQPSISNIQPVSGGVFVTIGWTVETTNLIDDQWIDEDLTGTFNPPSYSSHAPYTNPIGSTQGGQELIFSQQVFLGNTDNFGNPINGYWIRINDHYTTTGWFGGEPVFFDMQGLGGGGGGLPKTAGQGVIAAPISFTYQGPAISMRENLYMVGPDGGFYSLAGTSKIISLPNAPSPVNFQDAGVGGIIQAGMPSGVYDAAIYITSIDNGITYASKRFPAVWNVS